MIRKPNFRLNWKYAIGEIVLIFIGISLAIAFQNWNDQRKKNKLEQEILGQIYDDIKFNKTDVDGDYYRLTFGLESLLKIESFIAQDLPYYDSMCFDFFWIQNEEYAFPLHGGYDNLTRAGLDLIKNDSIREYIQAAYEYGYPRISKETTFYPDVNTFFSEYMQEHFTVNVDTSLVFERDTELGTIRYPYQSDLAGTDHLVHIGYVPNDWEKLKKDPQFKVMLRQSMAYRRNKLLQYDNVKLISDWLIQKLENELGIKNE